MKKLIENQTRVKLQLEKILGPLSKEESEARRLWTLGYNKYQNAVKKLNERRNQGLTTDPVKNGKTNQTVKNLWDTLEGWDKKSESLTKQRDLARIEMEVAKDSIIKSEQKLEKMVSEYQLELQNTNSIIDNVFLLNYGVVAALENMDKFLVQEVFSKLGNATQKSIENSTSTKKITIMTNSINKMDVAKVQEAQKLIKEFFERINPKTNDIKNDEMDINIQVISKLLEELLVIKIQVKAGPGLSKFLSMRIDEEKIPELFNAQKLLASAMSYSRSGIYIKISERDTKNDKWQPVRQS